MVYLGLTNILEKNEINYTESIIVQVSQVREKWESLNRKMNEVAISSIDAVEM